jgi:hypothetical protein
VQLLYHKWPIDFIANGGKGYLGRNSLSWNAFGARYFGAAPSVWILSKNGQTAVNRAIYVLGAPIAGVS